MGESLDPGARRFSVQLRGAGSKPHLPATGPGVTYLSVRVAHSISELGLDHLRLTAASPLMNSELLIFPSIKFFILFALISELWRRTVSIIGKVCVISRRPSPRTGCALMVEGRPENVWNPWH